jgi:hypothetical protein
MPPLAQPLRFLLGALAGWINQQQHGVIAYLQEENRVLGEQLGPRRLRFTDDQRIRLAAKAKRLGRRRPRSSVPRSHRIPCSRGIGNSSPESMTATNVAVQDVQACRTSGN